MNRRQLRRLALVALLMLGLALPALAQFGRRYMPAAAAPVAYNGDFVIVRLWYPRYPGWSDDYPEMEENFTLILKDISLLPAHPNGSNIFRMDDPELMKFPVADPSEPGYWQPSESEVIGLRTYLAKGGFLIVDDFHFENEWQVFEAAMRRVLPDARIDRLDASHPIFNSFFSIKSLDVPYPGRLGEQGLTGEFYGIHEGNDKSKRLSVVINYNMDIGDYMEHSGQGWFAVDPTNEAFKFGVNYLVYGMTHSLNWRHTGMTRTSRLLGGAIAATILLQTISCAPPAPEGARVVDIQAPDGVVLKGTLFAAPAGGPAVLLLHQCDDQRHVWDPLGPKLAAAGITALAIDYRGYGESGGTPHDKLPNAEQNTVETTKWPGDIDAAFAFLSKQPGVQPARAGAAGGSCGVFHAIEFARRHNTVKALALLAGGPNRDGRLFLETPAAPPVFAAAAADDRYANFVEIMRWMHGVSPHAESRFAQYPTGGHAAVVFQTHPELADSIAQWFAALLKDPPGALPATNGVPLPRSVLDELHAIDRPGGAAAAIARLTANRGGQANAPRVPEYIVNLLGYEHIQMKDYGSAIDLMRLNTLLYPDSANTMDSVGDAYLAAGDQAAALAAAKRTLELLAGDPQATPEQKTSLRTAAEDKIKRLSGPPGKS